MVFSASMSLFTASMSLQMVAGEDENDGDLHEDHNDDDHCGDDFLIDIAPKLRCSVDHDLIHW